MGRRQAMILCDVQDGMEMRVQERIERRVMRNSSSGISGSMALCLLLRGLMLRMLGWHCGCGQFQVTKGYEGAGGQAA